MKKSIHLSGTAKQILRRKTIAQAVSLALFVGYAQQAAALPTGGEVAAGSATISQPAANQMQIDQSSQKVILNWQSFSIAGNEGVHFFQPTGGIALNRVLGTDPSNIFGSLTATGKVFLVNPNGILFGPGASVDVGGLVASTLNIGDSDFLAGNYRFTNGGSAGNVLNQGVLNAASGGYVALLAPEVRNEGIVSARLGAVAIGAGDRVRLDFNGDRLINLTVEQSAVQSLIENRQLVQADGGTVIMSARAAGDLAASVINNTGIIKAASLVERNGTIRLEGAHALINTGTISVAGENGASGGEVRLSATNVLQSGLIDASGTGVAVGNSTGGRVTIEATGSILQTQNAMVRADGVGAAGGIIIFDATPQGGLYLSGTLSTTGETGGMVKVLGADLKLAGTHIDASGGTGGGEILIGGDYQGRNAQIPNAQSVVIGLGTTLDASAKENGNGGKVIVWSEAQTAFAGHIEARGGNQAGDGGFIEISSRGALGFGGTVDASATNGRAGTFLLDPKNILIDASAPTSLLVEQLVDPHPQTADLHSSGGVWALSSGNIIVASPFDNFTALGAGAVYLYDGSTRALISTLTGITLNDHVGSGGVRLLTNGNFVVSSPLWNNAGLAVAAGAATWGSGITGVNGAVSVSNSLVGTTASDQVSAGGITALTNGNYVVNSPLWSNAGLTGAGAVTWGNGATGTTGAVSTSNSLVGAVANGEIGSGGVTALTNGNYVVNSPLWINAGLVAAGAVTWGNGTTGTIATVSSSNSLVGDVANDSVGSGGVTALTNGNYVVSSPLWINGLATTAGAVTWGDGTSGVTGAVSVSNSLVGSTTADQVGSGGVTALTNGNYVVSSSSWNNGGLAAAAGAATRGNGTTGVTGAVSTSNSLVGSIAADQVSSGGITALTNGNYVVLSPLWINGLATTAGAATWGNGTTGVTGAISASNSLVGSTTADRVGSAGVTTLNNGNYVVDSPNWNATRGAATWGSGTSGVTGTVAGGNSLVGSTVGDNVGSDGITALTNGNYVVSSPAWNNGGLAAAAGAATWGSGTSGITGAVTSSNSLVGAVASDQVGSGGVTALTNGNYVVGSPSWINGLAAAAGAATWSSGTSGITGTVSSSNSLVGTVAADSVSSGGIAALTNGNYVVNSPLWSNGGLGVAIGAATWSSGTSGITGAVSASNSLVGSVAGDTVGGGGITALANGNYVVSSPLWNNGGLTVAAGAATWGSGTIGITGSVSSSNSLVGAFTADNLSSGGITPLANGSFVVSSPIYDNGTIVTGMAHYVTPSASGPIVETYAINPSSDVTLSATQISNILSTGTNLLLQANNDITVNTALSATNGGTLTLQAGRSVLVNANIATGNGDLTVIANDNLENGVVDLYRDPGLATITMASGTVINAGSGDVTMQLLPGTGKLFNTSGAITLGSVSAGTINVVNQGPTVASNVILRSGATLTATDNGTSILLAAVGAGGGTFTNQGTNNLDPGPGRYLVYSDTPANTTEGMSGYNKRYATTYPATTGVGAGNYFLYSIAPTLAVTADAKTKIYGDVDPSLTYGATGFIDGDTMGTALTGALARAAGQTVAGGPYAINQGALADVLGYSINYTGANLVITPRTVTANVTANNKAYDGTTAATLNGTSLANAIGGDAVSFSVGSTLFSDKNVGTGKTVTIGGLALTGADAGNYLLAATSATAAADITARAVTASVTANNKVYDGTTAATLSGTSLANVLGGETVNYSISSVSFGDKTVGTGKTITAGGLTLTGADAGNYVLSATSATSTANITPLTVNPSVTANNKIYDGTTTATLSSTSLANAIGGDAISLSAGSVLFGDKNVGNGKTVTAAGLALTGADAGNYLLLATSATSTANITLLTVSASITANNKVYDGTTAATLSAASLPAAIGGDSVSLNIGSTLFGDKNAGNGKTVTAAGLALTGADAGNYLLSSTSSTSTANITPLTVTANVTANNKVYDGTTAAMIGVTSLPAAIGGDAVSVSVGSSLFGDKNVGVGKTVTASGLGLTGTDAGNYLLSASSATTTTNITPLTISASVTANNKVYDGTTAATLSATSLPAAIGGDSVSLNIGSTLFSDKNVGAGKTVTASGLGLTGADAGNYLLSATSATGIADITPLTINASITANNKIYDGTTAATLGATSLPTAIAGDVVSVNVSSVSFGDKNVGTGKTVTAGGLELTGADGGNYLLSATSATGSANITPLTVSASVTANNKVYDGTTTATLSATSLPAAIGGDAVNLSVGSALFSDKNGGAGKAVTVSGLTLTGTDAGNYLLSGTSATSIANITPLSVTANVTANNKIYDGTTTATLGATSLPAAVVGDSVSVSIGSALFGDKNVGAGKTITASGLALTGIDAGNYLLATTSATSTANISPLTVAANVMVNNKVYDGTTTASVGAASLPTAIAGDNINVNVGSASFGDKNVGTGKTVTASGLALTGVDAGNYQLAATSTTGAANITPLVVSANVTVNDKVYDGTTTAVVATTSIPAAIGGDNVSVNVGNASFSDRNVGIGKITTASSLTLTGTDAGNYSLTTTSVTGTASIAPRTVTAAANNQSKIYGSPDPVLTFTVGGMGLAVGDTATDISGTLARAPGEIVASSPYAITQGTLASSGNYAVMAFTPAVLTITPAQLTIAADNKNKIQGQPNRTLTAGYGGLTNGDSAAVVTGLSLATIAIDTSPIGSYAITPSGASAPNYIITYADGVLAILPLSAQLIPGSPVVLASLEGLRGAVLTAQQAHRTQEGDSGGGESSLGGCLRSESQAGNQPTLLRISGIRLPDGMSNGTQNRPLPACSSTTSATQRGVMPPKSVHR